MSASEPHPPCKIKYPRDGHPPDTLDFHIPDLRTAPKEIQNKAILAFYFNQSHPGGWKSEGQNWIMTPSKNYYLIQKLEGDHMMEYKPVYRVDYVTLYESKQNLEDGNFFDYLHLIA